MLLHYPNVVHLRLAQMAFGEAKPDFSPQVGIAPPM
jgi:hypothetical protein